MPTNSPLLDEGWKLHQAGDLSGAEERYRRMLAQEPQNASAWCYLGILRFDQRKFEDSIAAYRKAIEFNPRMIVAYNNLGNVLHRTNRTAEALANYDAALRLKPDYAAALSNRSAALLFSGQLDAAVDSATRALALTPDDRAAQKVVATAKLWQGQFAEAEADYRRILEIDPSDAESHVNLSMILLLRGNFVEGWPEYAWRMRLEDTRKLKLPGAEWDGSPLDGRTILLASEQGLGDTLQFIRFAEILKQKYGCRVVAAVQKPLLPILKTYRHLDALVPMGGPLPEYDVWAAMLAVPQLIGQRSIDDFPCSGPYLSADEQLVQSWGERLRTEGGFKIGVAWQGNPDLATDKFRSVPLHELMPLVRWRGVRLFGLQRGPGVEQMAFAGQQLDVTYFGNDFDTASGPFMDTAAVMKNLDLVVTSDTAIAHLAGALGVPVWVALGVVPDWRWALDRQDTPWYPTMRLFRQTKTGDWKGVFQQMAAEIPQVAPNVRRRQPEDYRVADTGLHRLVRGKHGLMLYNPFDKYIGRSIERYGEFSDDEVDLFRQLIRPGSIVVEAGANIGTHTVPLARIAGVTGAVYAFEPQRILFQILAANVAVNSLVNVHCRQAAVGEQPGELLVPPLDYSQENNFGGLGLGQFTQGEPVPVVTVDSLKLPHCEFLKADVEGMEINVLRGAAKTIERFRPLLYVENDRQDRSAPLVAHIRSLGYKLYWHRTPMFSPRNHFENAHNEFGNILSFNMLCIHSSVPANIQGLHEVQ